MATREIISTGNELAAIAGVDAGCTFFGGYPLTPSSEIMHVLSDLLPKAGGTCIQMEDEIAAICSVIGAGMAGERTMTGTSGPGMSLKAENLGLAQMAEVPLVCVNVMRGGPSTGLPTRVSQGDILQSKNPSHGDYKSITLCAGSLAECYTETVRAFNLADRFMRLSVTCMVKLIFQLLKKFKLESFLVKLLMVLLKSIFHMSVSMMSQRFLILCLRVIDTTSQVFTMTKMVSQLKRLKLVEN